MANLAFIYKDLCISKNFPEHDFNPQYYHDALINCLRAYSKEDSNEHGRLKELQKMLCEIDDRVPDLEVSDQEHFQQNVVISYEKKFRKKHSNTSDLENYTEQYTYYSNWSNLFKETHPEKIEKRILPTIKSALLNKKGIFDDDTAYQLLDSYFDQISKKIFSKRSEEIIKTGGMSEKDFKNLDYEGIINYSNEK